MQRQEEGGVKRGNNATYFFKHQSEDEDSDSEKGRQKKTKALRSKTELEIKRDKSSRAKNNSENEKDVESEQMTVSDPSLGAKLRTVRRLHYSTEDIHLLAKQAELLVLTSSPPTEDSDSSDSDYVSRSPSLQALAHPLAKDLGKSQSLDKICRKSLPEALQCFPSAFSPDEDLTEDLVGALEEKDEREGDKSEETKNESCSLADSGSAAGSWDHDLQEQYISEGNSLEFQQPDSSMKGVLCFGEDYSSVLRRPPDLPGLQVVPPEVSEFNRQEIEGGAGSPGPTVLRMSERDWVIARQELEEVEKANTFGDKGSLERLLSNCTSNMEVLRRLQAENHEECELKKDELGGYRDMETNWKLLGEELGRRLSQFGAYTTINREIEALQGDLDNLTKISTKQGELDTVIEEYKDALEELEKNVKPALHQTISSVQLLNSEVSTFQPECVQKIALLCYCKQELISLSDVWVQTKNTILSSLVAAQQASVGRDQFELELVAFENKEKVSRIRKSVSITLVPATRRLRLLGESVTPPLKTKTAQVDLNEEVLELREQLQQLKSWLSEEYYLTADKFFQSVSDVLKHGPASRLPSNLSSFLLLSSLLLVLLHFIFQVLTALATLVQNTARWPSSLLNSIGLGDLLGQGVTS